MQDILRSEEFLTHLAYLFEEGISLTPDLEASKLYHNMLHMVQEGKHHSLLLILKDLYFETSSTSTQVTTFFISYKFKI